MLKPILKLVEYVVILTAVAMLAYVLGAQDALDHNDQFVNLCHAKSEDSPPTDCDFHDGAWWPRGSAE